MKGYDPACEDLAEAFIEDPPAYSKLLAKGYTLAQLDHLRRDLAQHIQDAIEGWFAQQDEGEGDGDAAHHG